MSRFYHTGTGDPGAPRELEEYSGLHHGPIRPGDRVVYENPALRQNNGVYWANGMDGPLVVTEIIDFGEGLVQAVLNDGQWECDAGSLRALPEDEA